MPLISIIVPVYNVASYLSACLDSILSQSFSDFEVQLVDDGSTDGSGPLCDELAAKDPRIVVSHQKNGGVSSARNLALEQAQGEWILFVDADDALLPDGLSELVGGISDEVDLVMLDFVESARWEEGMPFPHGEGKMVGREEALASMFIGTDRRYQGYVFAKLFRRSLLKEHHLRFAPAISIKEDTLFVVHFLCLSDKRVFFSETPVYHYIQRPSSAMTSLKETYSPKYLTSFEAVVRMNRLVESAFPAERRLQYLGREEVMNRVYRILSHMISHDAVDQAAISRIKKQAFREVGVAHYLDYQFRRNKRRAARIFNRLFNTHFHV